MPRVWHAAPGRRPDCLSAGFLGSRTEREPVLQTGQVGRDRVEGRRVTSLLKHVSAQRPQNRAGNSSLHPARQYRTVFVSWLFFWVPSILPDGAVDDIPGRAALPTVLLRMQSSALGPLPALLLAGVGGDGAR